MLPPVTCSMLVERICMNIFSLLVHRAIKNLDVSAYFSSADSLYPALRPFVMKFLTLYSCSLLASKLLISALSSPLLADARGFDLCFSLTLMVIIITVQCKNMTTTVHCFCVAVTQTLSVFSVDWRWSFFESVERFPFAKGDSRGDGERSIGFWSCHAVQSLLRSMRISYAVFTFYVNKPIFKIYFQSQNSFDKCLSGLISQEEAAVRQQSFLSHSPECKNKCLTSRWV